MGVVFEEVYCIDGDSNCGDIYCRIFWPEDSVLCSAIKMRAYCLHRRHPNVSNCFKNKIISLKYFTVPSESSQNLFGGMGLFRYGQLNQLHCTDSMDQSLIDLGPHTILL